MLTDAAGQHSFIFDARHLDKWNRNQFNYYYRKCTRNGDQFTCMPVDVCVGCTQQTKTWGPACGGHEVSFNHFKWIYKLKA